MNNIRTNGAKAGTASADGLQPGVRASQAMVDNDIGELNKMKHCYESVGRKYGVQPSLVAAIASRESRGGAYIRDSAGWQKGGGQGYGIMQVDIGSSGHGQEAKQLAWNSCELVDLAVGKIFVPFKNAMAQNHPDWTQSEQLKGAVAAYNCGDTRVTDRNNIDASTTGRDYSDDVIARAQHLVNSYGWN